ncbi:MAG: hypothetical protein ACREHD_09685, partial [Pirellulales bacterium]
LQAANDALEKRPGGSVEAIERKRKIEAESADLELQVQLNKKDFFEREAAIYLEVYQEIMKDVATYADARGITLVMRFNGDNIDLNDPSGVAKELNKLIIYHKGIDITDEILQIVNAKPGV